MLRDGETAIIYRNNGAYYIAHPTRGECVLIDSDGWQCTDVTIDRCMVANIDGQEVMLHDCANIDEATDQLILDGYSKEEISKMNLRSTNTVTF